MKILVTGGAGYIGNLLVEELLEVGHQVTLLDNFMFGYNSILRLVTHKNLGIIKADIRQDDLSYLNDKDVVYHLAAISGALACKANPHSAMEINLRASERIASHLGNEQLLIFASTTSLYGGEGGICNEDTPINAYDIYSETKYLAEQSFLQRKNSICLRWATIFGVSPRMRDELLVHEFVRKALKERAVVLYRSNSERTFLHIYDCIQAYLFVLGNADVMQGQVWNMGCESLNLTKMEVAKIIQRYVDYEIVESELTPPGLDKRDFTISFEKIRSLGFHRTHRIDDGIQELIKLYSFYDPHTRLTI